MAPRSTGNTQVVEKKAPAKTIVIFNEARAWHIWKRGITHVDPKETNPVKAVKVEQLDMTGATKNRHMVSIVPGVNMIDTKDWDEIKDHFDVKFKIKKGLLKVNAIQGEDKKPVGDISKLKDLKTLDDESAVLLVENTMDAKAEETLTAWQEAEDRPEVLDAITKQLKAIKGE